MFCFCVEKDTVGYYVVSHQRSRYYMHVPYRNMTRGYFIVSWSYTQR